MESRISPMNQQPAEKVVTEIALLLQQAIVGYRFHPTDEELINYLKSKVTGCRETFCIIPTLENIYEINPWDLPAKFDENSIVRSKDQEWWFICPQTQNQRISRKTPCGFSWKITGKHIDIKAKNDDKKIGSKITLVFIDGRNSKGTRSNWVLHEFHPHPDDTGFVIYCLKMKQYEKADTHAAVATNGDFSSTPQFQNHEVSFSELNEVIGKLSDEVYGQSDGSYQNRTKSLALIQEDNHYSSPNQERLEGTKDPSSTENSSGRGLAVPDPTNDELNFPHPFPNVDFCSANEAEKETINQLVAELFRSMEEEVDEMSGEQADKSCDSMDCDNPEQLPSAEHRVQEIQNQLRRLITNESSSSTEISSGSCHTGSSEWSRIRPRMPPLGHALFPNGDLFRLNDLSSETEADRVIQYCQLGETSRDNCRAEKNQRPVCDTLEGAVPGEEKGFAEEKLNHPHDMEKIITECTSSDGVPAKGKAQAGEFKEKETTMIRPQEKNFEMKIESDNMFHGESWTESLSPTRSIPSTSCSCRNRSTIDPAVYFARLMALVLVVGLIVDGICRKSDGISEIKKVYVFYGRI